MADSTRTRIFSDRAYKTPGRGFSQYETRHEDAAFWGDDFFKLDESTWVVVEVTLNTTINTDSDQQSGGVVAMIIDSDSNAEDATLHWVGDERGINLTGSAYVEFRAAIEVLPTSGTTLVMGVGGDHNLAKDSMTESAWFRLSGDANLLTESDDTTNDTSTDTGIDLVAAEWHTYSIDFSSLADVQFFFDGVRVNSGTAHDMSNLTAAEAMVQPYFSLDKASGTSVGTILLDYFKVWTPRE